MSARSARSQARLVLEDVGRRSPTSAIDSRVNLPNLVLSIFIAIPTNMPKDEAKTFSVRISRHSPTAAIDAQADLLQLAS
jgi:hypothetical protein